MKKFIMIAIIATMSCTMLTACGAVNEAQHVSADTCNNDQLVTKNDYMDSVIEISTLETTNTAVTTTFPNVSKNLSTTSTTSTSVVTTTTTTSETTTTSIIDNVEQTDVNIVATDNVIHEEYRTIDNGIVYYQPSAGVMVSEYIEPSYEVIIPTTEEETTTIIETTIASDETDNTESYTSSVDNDDDDDAEEDIISTEEDTTANDDTTYLGNFRITGYVATGNKTASGTWPSAGRTIAMNNSQRKELGLSYGDQIYIDGLGTYTLEDSGCAYGRIDVFCNSVSDCYALPSYLDAYLAN